MNRQIGDRALVVGGSMAGLLAARVLADSYGEVSGNRPGRSARGVDTPARRPPRPPHPCTGGARAASPGGAVPGAHPGTGRRRGAGRGHPHRRALLPQRPPAPPGEHRADAALREPTVPRGDTCGTGCGRCPTCGSWTASEVVGLATTPDGRRVTGARVLRRTDGSAEELLGADLVVDASGRGSRTPAWLEALDYPRPERQEVQIASGLCNPDLPAGTRRPRRKPGHPGRCDTRSAADRGLPAPRGRSVDPDACGHPR